MSISELSEVHHDMHEISSPRDHKEDHNLVEGKSLTFTKFPVHLEWKDLVFRVQDGPIYKRKTKTILNFQNHTCNMYPGEVLAIMGPSGCGKTTALSLLAGREKNYEGGITINGEPYNNKFYSISAFVQQDDILNGNLTVRQSLLFTAFLRLPTTFSIKEKIKIVDDIIEELGLTNCANVKIGNTGLNKGISGGERKRVSIATELITNPSVLFLDEPTSGLDSKTAQIIIELIMNLAKKGKRTVLMSIHQPRSSIFNMFDKLLLLTQGKIAYFGPAKDAVTYFEKIGYQCPTYYNPADYMIDLVSEAKDHGKVTKESEKERMEKIIIEYEKVPKMDIVKMTDEVPISKMKIPEYSTNMISQFFVLLVRSFMNIIFDFRLSLVKLFQTVLLALIVGFIYMGTNYGQKGVQDRTGVLFYLLMQQTMQGMMGPLLVFQQEKKVFIRERGSKTYQVLPYYLAKTTAELPFQIFFPSVAVLIVYWMANLNPRVERFFTFWLIIIVTAAVGQALGLVIGAAAPNGDVALAIAPLIQVGLMLFSGFYANTSNIPVWLSWLNYLSFLRYAFEAIAINEFEGAIFTCQKSELINGLYCPVTKGEQVIKKLSMENGNIWLDFAVLCSMFISFRIIGYLFLRYANQKK